jgi:hypothetical protein
MGTTLTGTTPQDTYDSLIKVTDNGPISGTLKALSDGLGNDSTLSLSTTAASIAGTLAVSGDFSIADKIVHIGDTNTAIRFPAADTITFETSGAEVVRIGSTGLVGIGVTATNKLDVAGNIGVPTTNFYRYDGDTALIGSATTIVGGTASQLGIRAANEILFATNGATEKMRLTSDSYMRMAASTGGIQFNGDTAAANALDDYEEGTWTMGVSFGGASVGVTYASNTGTYTKIGRQVTVNGYINLSSKGSSTGDARITGLPFTIPNSNQSFASASLFFINIAFTNQYQGFGEINATTISLQESTILGSVTTISNSDFANNSGIILSLTYFV